MHMVSAWCSTNNMVLGQVKTDAKSNEINAIPELLRMLSIKGCTVTIDAMGCQTAIAAQIVEKDADYLLAVKGNQGYLLDDMKEAFEQTVGTAANQHYPGDRAWANRKKSLRCYFRYSWVCNKKEWKELNGKKVNKRLIKIERHYRLTIIISSYSTNTNAAQK